MGHQVSFQIDIRGNWTGRFSLNGNMVGELPSSFKPLGSRIVQAATLALPEGVRSKCIFADPCFLVLFPKVEIGPRLRTAFHVMGTPNLEAMIAVEMYYMVADSMNIP